MFKVLFAVTFAFGTGLELEEEFLESQHVAKNVNEERTLQSFTLGDPKELRELLASKIHLSEKQLEAGAMLHAPEADAINEQILNQANVNVNDLLAGTRFRGGERKLAPLPNAVLTNPQKTIEEEIEAFEENSEADIEAVEENSEADSEAVEENSEVDSEAVEENSEVESETVEENIEAEENFEELEVAAEDALEVGLKKAKKLEDRWKIIAILDANATLLANTPVKSYNQYYLQAAISKALTSLKYNVPSDEVGELYTKDDFEDGLSISKGGAPFRFGNITGAVGVAGGNHPEVSKKVAKATAKSIKRAGDTLTIAEAVGNATLSEEIQ